MRQVEGTVAVLKVATPERDAWGGCISLVCLLVLTIGSSAMLAAETSPLEHAKPTASVVSPPKIGSPKTLDAAKQSVANPALCAPGAEPGKNGEATKIAPQAVVNKNKQDASSPSASDLTVKLPPHEELEKDEIRLPADAQTDAGNANQADANQDKDEFRVGLKDSDKEGEPVNGAAGSPPQCSLPSATQTGTGSPPH